MKSLKEIKKVDVHADYPTTFEDLNWSLDAVDIRNPKYLYSLQTAIYERINKNMLANESASNGFGEPTLFYAPVQFIEYESFTFSTFIAIYSTITQAIFSFVNIEKWERCYRLEDGKTTTVLPSFCYQKKEVDEILGYDFYEIPKKNQPFDYYKKFLIGMKNCIQNMKWKFVDIWATTTYEGRSVSDGGYRNQIDNTENYKYYNGTLQGAYDKLVAANKSKINPPNGTRNVITIGTNVSKKWWFKNGGQSIDGSAIGYSVFYYAPELFIRSYYYFPCDGDIKIFYVPWVERFTNNDYSIFYDNSEKKTYLNDATYNKNIVLYESGRAEKNKVYEAQNFPLNIEKFIPHEPIYFKTPSSGSGTVTKTISYLAKFTFFGFFNIEEGCSFR